MKPMVFDLETSINDEIHGASGKSKLNDFYTLIYGTSPDAVIVEHKEKGFNRDASHIFNNCDLLIGHNLPFDCSYILDQFKTYIVSGGCIWDTQYAEYLLSGQRHTMASLAELQTIYLGEKYKRDRISALYKKGIGADKILSARNRCHRLFKEYEFYCYEDGSTTLNIFKQQYVKAKKCGMLSIISMYMKFLSSLILMQSEGLLVDRIKCESTLRDFKVKALEHMSNAEKLAATHWNDERLPKFNIQSPAHKSAVLFGGTIKCKVKREIGYTKKGDIKTKLFEEEVEVKGFGVNKGLTAETSVKGRYVTDTSVVNKIYNECGNKDAVEYCKQQKLAMNYNKMCSTYLEAFLNLSMSDILYPNFNHALTATGRLSSSNPNMQNIPSHGDMGDVLQGQFIAPEGYVCVSIDYSQLEIYIVAWLSGDQSLTNDLLIGTDMHIKRLSYAENKTYDEVYKLCKIDKVPGWDEKRSKAKTISYQKAYGASVKSLARTTKLTEETVQRIFDLEDEEYFKVKEFNDEVEKTAKQLRLPSLSRHFPAVKKKGGKNGKRFNKHGEELLPIYNDQEEMTFTNEVRTYGVYDSITGRKFTFEEFGRLKNNRVTKGLSKPQLMNYPIQGSAGDVVAAAVAELGLYVLSSNGQVKMVNTIHDSVWFYIKKNSLALHVYNICTIMKSPKLLIRKLPFEIPVEVKTGDNFGNMDVYDYGDLK